MPRLHHHLGRCPVDILLESGPRHSGGGVSQSRSCSEPWLSFDAIYHAKGASPEERKRSTGDFDCAGVTCRTMDVLHAAPSSSSPRRSVAPRIKLNRKRASRRCLGEILSLISMSGLLHSVVLRFLSFALATPLPLWEATIIVSESSAPARLRRIPQMLVSVATPIRVSAHRENMRIELRVCTEY
jgi:hypothetical protein